MLIADENVPAAAIEALRTRGMDVLSVRESATGQSDQDVLRLANEQQRILITFDRDYGELIFRHGNAPPPAVIFLRFQPVSALAVADTIADILHDGGRSIRGRMVIVSSAGVRERQFPKERG